MQLSDTPWHIGNNQFSGSTDVDVVAANEIIGAKWSVSFTVAEPARAYIIIAGLWGVGGGDMGPDDAGGKVAIGDAVMGYIRSRDNRTTWRSDVIRLTTPGEYVVTISSVASGGDLDDFVFKGVTLVYTPETARAEVSGKEQILREGETYTGGRSQYKQIRAANESFFGLTVNLSWHTAADEWRDASWTFEGHESAYLGSDGKRIEADKIKYSAVSQDGTVFWHKDQKEDVVEVSKAQGDTYTVSFGDFPFDTARDAYSFSNYGDAHPEDDEAGFRMAFLPGAVCEPGTDVLKPSAEAFMHSRSWNEGGNCMGFATSVGFFYARRHKLSDFRQPDRGEVTAVSGYVRDDEQSQPDRRVIDHLIEAAGWLWIGKETEKLSSLPLGQVLERCGAYPENVIVLATDTSAHAMLTLKGEKTDNEHGRIAVYDSNAPGETRFVDLDLAGGRWRFDHLPGFSGGPDTLTLVPVQSLLKYPMTPDGLRSSDPSVRLRTPGAGDANVMITDSSGRRLGFENGRLVRDIPGARYVPGFDGGPGEFVLPSAMETGSKVEIQSFSKGSYQLAAVGPRGVVTVEVARPETGARDTLDMLAGGEAVRFRPAANTPELQIGVVAYTAEGDERELKVGGARATVGDAFAVRAYDGAKWFEVDNAGTSQRLAISYRQTGPNRARADQTGVVVDAYETRTYTPEVSGTGEVSLLVGVDRGRDGTIDRWEHIRAWRPGSEEEIVTDAPPQIQGGRVLVPLRAIFEWLGAEVKYNGATKQVTATMGQHQVELTLGKREASVDGKPVLLEVPGKATRGRTYVPLRFVSEALGAQVEWKAAERRVVVTFNSRTGWLKVP
jgi:hypothetical protein